MRGAMTDVFDASARARLRLFILLLLAAAGTLMWAVLLVGAPTSHADTRGISGSSGPAKTDSSRGGAHPSPDRPTPASSTSSGSAAKKTTPAAVIVGPNPSAATAPARTTIAPAALTPPKTAAATAAATESPTESPSVTRGVGAISALPQTPQVAFSTDPAPIAPDVLARLTAPSAATSAAAARGDTGNIGLGNVGSWNLGNGNVGDNNIGFGNAGNRNVGSGNAGDGNVGFGNLGDKNVGAGNNGDGNIGFGNTGNNNLGFGNTGNNNVGIGLTGDNQMGFGGWNSGTNNTGLFNSGSGNSGLFNSGTGNVGIGNSGLTNAGLFNAGSVNTGFGNVGSNNTGWHNIGSYNSGNANPGNANTGAFNAGDTNTGWANTGNSNTGLFNSGNVNTGAFNTGNLSNGFFVSEDNKNWLPGLRYTVTLPGINIDTTVPLRIDQTVNVADLTIRVGPVDEKIRLTGNTGPIEVVLIDIPSGPGFFNSSDAPSSGFFNSGAGGGSGLFNVGAGVSGLWNEAVSQLLGGPALLSGLGNFGSLGSGLGNSGSGVSGWWNLSSLDPGVAASLAGLGNVGSGFAGVVWNGLTGLPSLNLGFGDVGSLNIGGGNVGNLNLGFGNVGDWNLGNGNVGDNNVGFGNAGDGNIGLGNLGSKNVGAGNNGDGNTGFGNTGNNNVGFANTGNNNVGIGLTGDNQMGFGGWNSGSNNTGLFNSGSGNSGLFNSGTNNFGLFNSGDVNTGLGNAGSHNTGWNNAGSFNSGGANTGDANTGLFNAGNTNTGLVNTGDANTGLANLGDLNTGALNLGSGNNGLFWRTNDNGQLGIDIGATISEFPVTLKAEIPVDIPITGTVPLGQGPVTIYPGGTLPAITQDVNINTSTEIQPGTTLDLKAQGTLNLGPIVIPAISVQTDSNPLFTATIGGPDTTVPINVTGTLGPVRLSLLKWDGPGFFNSSDAPSSGFFNSGAGGGSGLFNVGAGVSGLWNEAVSQLLGGPALLSGLGNFGSLGSGLGNSGSGVSGWWNLSSLDPGVAASLAGLGNVGSGFAGVVWNGLTGLPSLNLGFGDVGSLNIGGGNVGNLNLGFGNVGDWNLGNGNVGDNNVGFGNAGDGNIGLGNLGSKNIGAGNNGDGNTGFGNTGNNNVGFANTGNNNVGIGLTGDNQMGFGGWNSGSNNTGLFNSGSGNSGLFNSGTNNFGLFNSGDVNTGLGNAGSHNTGWNNAGSFNSGGANTGDANTGLFNAGNTNTGLVNTGDANTGLANLGDLNTGALNLGSRNNGLFWRTNDNGQLNIGVGLTVSQIPVDLQADIPVDIPITATIGPDVLDVIGFTIPTIPGGLKLDPITLNFTVNSPSVKTSDIVFTQNPNIAIGPITVPNITFRSTDPLVSATIGGPDTHLPFDIGGYIGGTRISLLAFGGPGFFNSVVSPSSGFFNSSGGVDIGATVSPISASLSAKIPVDIPVNADLGGFGVDGFTIAGFPITTTNWTTIVNQVFTAKVLNTVNLRHVFDFTVLNGVLPVSDITIPTVDFELPTLTGAIGGAGATLPIDFYAQTTPFRIIPLLADTPVGVSSVGARGGGGSGLFNSGSGLSGLLNQSVIGALSGVFNDGARGSGSGNAGVGNSGWFNTGTQQSGVLSGWPGIGPLLARVVDRLRPAPPPALRGVTVTDLAIGFGFDIPVDIPVNATFAEPLVIPLITIPEVTIGPGPFIQAAIFNRATGGDFPGANPCGAVGNFGACIPLELLPTFKVGGGAGPITIYPGGDLTPAGQQVISATLGGIGSGVGIRGVVGVGPINVVGGSPVTIERFPYAYEGTVGIDVPITSDIGLIVSQFDETDIVQGTLAYKYGVCAFDGVGNICTPSQAKDMQTGAIGRRCDGNNPADGCHVTFFAWGTRSDTLTPPIDRNWPGYPRGPFPPDGVIAKGDVPVVDNSGSFVDGGRYINFAFNGGLSSSVPFSGGGTLGPFPDRTG